MLVTSHPYMGCTLTSISRFPSLPNRGDETTKKFETTEYGITGVSPSNMFCSSNSYEIIFVKSMMVSDNTSGVWTRIVWWYLPHLPAVAIENIPLYRLWSHQNNLKPQFSGRLLPTVESGQVTPASIIDIAVTLGRPEVLLGITV